MYKFYVTDNKVICVTTYAGKTVRGVAKCDPRDTFDEEFGKSLAKARADFKVANKRYDRAMAKLDEARAASRKAYDREEDMWNYLESAEAEYNRALEIMEAYDNT